MSEEVRSLLVGFRKNYEASIVGQLNCILSKISVEIFVNLPVGKDVDTTLKRRQTSVETTL